MEQSGEERWTAFAAGFRARILAALEKARESTANDPGCFSRWRESSTKCGPDTFSWRTHLILFAGDWTPFSGPWPRWGMMVDGVYSPLPQLVPYTVETDGGDCLPTPLAHDAKQAVTEATMARHTLDLNVYVAKYPTPKTNGFCGGSGNFQKIQGLSISQEAKRSMASGGGGSLNPDWVEWLMGWPPGWTDPEKPLRYSGPPTNGESRESCPSATTEGNVCKQ